MTRTTRFAQLAAPVVALSALVAPSTTFAAVPWTTPSGSTPLMSYSGGQSDGGLFGDPVVSGSTFLFFPSNFKATSSNGVAQTTSDRMSVVVNAPAGKTIQKVTITELGDWAITGGGSVKASGALYITKLNSPGFGTVSKDQLHTNYYDSSNVLVLPNPSTLGTSSGDWDGKFEITLPAGTTSVQVVLNNILQATSTANGTSFIEKKVLGGPDNGDPQFKIDVVVPEPTSAGMMVLGGAAVLLRRRRKAS